MIFTKEWYSIDESVEILNKAINGETLLTRRYIKDLFLEENLDLFIRTSLLSSNGVMFKNGVEIETNFSLFEEYSEEEIKSMEADIADEKTNTSLYICKDHFYGGGNFRVISDNCHIEDQDNDKFSILANSFRVFMNKDECKITDNTQDKLLSKNQHISIEIYSEDPVKIEFDDILIYIDDLLDTIKFIRNITTYSLNSISDDQQINALQAQIAELTAENERLRANQVETLPPSENAGYEGDIPPKTNEEKLAYFIRLLIDHNPQINLHSNEKPYTGRQVKTQLENLVNTVYTRKYGSLPSHNTIAKYLNE